MARRADEEVVRLDVAVNPLHLVGFFNAKDHLRQVLPGDLFIQYIFSQQQAEEVSADHVFHHQV
jgi:hypothetical protein